MKGEEEGEGGKGGKEADCAFQWQSAGQGSS